MHVLKPNPEATRYAFKPAFIERYSKLTDFEVFKKYSLSFLRKSIRVNTIKTSIAEIKKRMARTWQFEQIPWCNEGFWINHVEGRRDIGNTIEHVLGYIYVQEAASMIPPLVLDPQPDDRVLDIAAAPGSKTTQLAAMMHNKGILIANDVTGDRLASLGINIMRTGAANIVVTQSQGERMRELEFDKILVDAPCSGTGTIRKSLSTLEMWNPDMVTRLAKTQQRILRNAFNMLAPRGTLVYSTCSLEPEENEGVVSEFLNTTPHAKLLPIELDIIRSEPVKEWNEVVFHQDIKHCLRIWPQDNDTEGFFVAKIEKQE